MAGPVTPVFQAKQPMQFQSPPVMAQSAVFQQPAAVDTFTSQDPFSSGFVDPAFVLPQEPMVDLGALQNMLMSLIPPPPPPPPPVHKATQTEISKASTIQPISNEVKVNKGDDSGYWSALGYV